MHKFLIFIFALMFISCSKDSEVEHQFKKYSKLEKRCQIYRETIFDPLLKNPDQEELIRKLRPSQSNTQEYFYFQAKLNQWLIKNKDLEIYNKWQKDLKPCLTHQEEMQLIDELVKLGLKYQNSSESQIIHRKIREQMIYYFLIKYPDHEILLYILDLFERMQAQGLFKEIKVAQLPDWKVRLKASLEESKGDNTKTILKKILKDQKLTTEIRSELYKLIKSKRKK